MITPDRETAEAITWQLNGLLADSHALPPGLAATLRAYMTELLRRCADETWTRPGHRSRYGKLADTIGRHITDGTWQPGERMPALDYLATTYHEKEQTVGRALFVLAIRGQLAQERLAYYVLPEQISRLPLRASEQVSGVTLKRQVWREDGASARHLTTLFISNGSDVVGAYGPTTSRV